jgi:hypothetical protein
LEEQIRAWQRMIEDGGSHILDQEQVAALRSLLSWARARGMRTTILLYPRKPATLTLRAREATLAPFSRAVRELAGEFGAEFQDDTEVSVLLDAHFEPDFDHLTRDGHAVYAKHLLATVFAPR